MKSINPYNLKVIAEFDEDSDQVLEKKITGAEAAFKSFRLTTYQERAGYLENLSGLLLNKTEVYARSITLEMGKPIVEARAEVEKCAWLCRYYAEHGAGFLASEQVASDADESLVSYEPLGVVLAVMPWNFPFWQVFRFAVPALMAGNTLVLKHASNVQISADHLVDLFYAAGFPPSCFQNLRIASGRVEGVLRRTEIKAVSLTGSEAAGSAVASIAGEEIKPVVLELGGSCGFLVLADADIEKAAKLGVKARMINNAQSCIAAKRFIVAAEVYDAFLEAFTAELKGLKSGDPLWEDTQIGPMARLDLARELEQQMERSILAGARHITGGSRRDAYFEPCLLADVKPGMPAFDEELFGPVAAVIKATNDQDAIRLNNLSAFGLGASIITRDFERAIRLARQIEDGCVFVNELVKSDPRLPFGGTKKSGFGRELGKWGIRAFVNVKTLYVKKNLG